MLERHEDPDSGAAAVEFALVMVPLLLIVFAILEFGRYYNMQIEMSGAARAGVRRMAVTNNAGQAQDAAQAEAPNLSLTDAEIDVQGSCPPGSPNDVTVVISRATAIDLRLLPAVNFVATGTGVMRCGG
jgi:Flp pilus assembly protein TadG